MGKEIERKFLLANEGWRAQVQGSVDIRQGYLSSNEECSIRTRISGDKAFLNIKSATIGVERTEFEYPIPLADGNEILRQLCGDQLVEKTRHYIPAGAHTWEVDVFRGANEGLVVAEIELGAADEPFERPAWLGEEVSSDPRYYNVRLIEHPFKNWV
jgi:adenylate cyclase